MRDYRGLIESYEQSLSNADVRDIALNYSKSEVGLRSPGGPVGFMVRDQGQVDLYAGAARHILTLDGYVLTLGTAVATLADWITLTPKSIRTLVLAGKTIDEDVFDKQKIAAFLPTPPRDLGDLWFCDAEGNPAAPVSSIVEEKSVFHDARYPGLQSPEVSLFALSDAAMRN